MSDIVSYADHNPDMFREGCVNTGEASDGVVFLGVDLEEMGETCFIGRQSIIEAFGELYELTPAKVKKLLNANETVKELEEQLALADNEIRRWRDFGERMEENGLVIQLME